MSLSDLRRALEPTAEGERPFAAAKRSAPRRAEIPSIVHFDLPYRQWDGPKLPWKEDFGKGRGQVYSRDGAAPERSCNEVEVAKRLRRIRDNAFWLSCYSPDQIPDLWRPWTKAPKEAPDWLLSLEDDIRQAISAATGGIPDVVAWNNENSKQSALFVECKGTKESFKEGQEDWVTAALQSGIAPEQFAVAIRTFA